MRAPDYHHLSTRIVFVSDISDVYDEQQLCEYLVTVYILWFIGRVPLAFPFRTMFRCIIIRLCIIFYVNVL